MNKPKYLYKYHSAKRVAQIIRDLTFYFAPVSQLNDLIEFRVKSLYTETPESKLKVFAKHLIYEGACDTVDEALEFIKESNLIEEAESDYAYTINELNKQLHGIMKHSGVTCFSEHRNNQRMWASYGDNHSGAVIEFYTSSESSAFASYLMPVYYLKQKPKICPSELLTNSMTLDQWFCGALCCFKSYDWRDEGEWRLLLLTDTEQSPQARIEPFKRSAISRIFLGPNISEENEKEIRNAAQIHSPEIPVYKRIIDETEAKEDLLGFEIIHSFEQLEYWMNRPRR